MDGYTIQGELYRGRRRVVHRAVRDSDQAPVIIKSLLVGVATEDDVAAVQHEFDLLSSLSVEGVPRAHGIVADANALNLVLEDRGGSTLAEYMRSSAFDLTARLDMAIALTEVLAQVHGQHVVHRDINPSNVLVDAEGAVLLIDFGISMQQAEEQTPVSHPFRLEGTLAFLSPEQTGRMNRVVDYRTDYYSLGVTLFELFAGELPFMADDPMELIYCHIAVLPPSADEIAPQVPRSVAAVVGKLLEKAPEDRYQSAAGIVHDLRACRDFLYDVPDDFRAGLQDARVRFAIPKKLYGRQDELQVLMTAFDRASQGGVELVFVAGYSGIGKSALVHAVQTPISKRRGYFVAGKYDQLRLTIPYSAIVASLSELVAQLLTEPDDALLEWKRKLLEALGANGQLVVDVIPELGHIIGPQPEVPAVDVGESGNRFRLVFQSFIRVFCQPEHPLVLFLDDLQWVDPASLALIDTILTDGDGHHLLVIGAYRDNEVDDSHPLTAAVSALASEDRVRVSRLALGPLPASSVTELLMDTLHCGSRDDSERLQRLVIDKTAGNPFFLKQFLATLHHRGAITLDSSSNRWVWDIDELEAMNITDNVVALMMSRLRELPAGTSEMLALASCIGSRFQVSTLESLSSDRNGPSGDLEHDDVAALLGPAIEAGLVVPDQGRRGRKRAGASERSMRFLHDRVQQAASAMLDERAKQEVHLRIGLTLKSDIVDVAKSEDLFRIVDHLNAGVGLIGSETERRELAALNLESARRAVSATAYVAARDYAESALTCLPSDNWETDYELTRDLHRVLVDAQYLRGDFEASQGLIETMLPRLIEPVEQAEVLSALVVQQTLGGNYREATRTCLDALDLLGLPMPAGDLEEALRVELERYAESMDGREPGRLLDAPEVTAPEMGVALRLLGNLLPLCYIADPPLCRVTATRMVNLSLEHGHTPDSAIGYAFFGLVHSSVLHQYQDAYSFGQLALAMCDRYSDASQLCRSSHMFCAFINHWNSHLREFDAINRRGFQAGLQSGELQYAGYHRYNRALCLFHLGTHLKELVPELEELVRFSRQTRNQHATDPVVAVMRATLDLAGSTAEPASFEFEGATESDFLEDLQSRNAIPALCHYRVLKSQVLYLYGRIGDAQRHSEQAAASLPFISGHFSVVVHEFYAALIAVALVDDGAPEDRAEFIRRIERRQERLQRWADSCPDNFAYMALLVAAEVARLEGERWSAAELFDRAIEEAGRSGYLQGETLARERAGVFWLGQKRHKVAAVYLSEAHHGYQLWGASRKARMLAEEHGGLIAGASVATRSAGATSMPFLTLLSSTGAALDFATVMKASRSISKEVDKDELVKQLIRIAIETAGAQRGFLLLHEDGKLAIEASGTLDDGETRSSPPIRLGATDDVPASVVNYVARTKETLTIADAGEDPRFSRDAVSGGSRIRSVMCVPILSRGSTAAVLYLEHNSVSGVFTPDRVEILESLAAQATISLENAGLYEERKKTAATLQTTLAELQLLKGQLEKENLLLQEEIETQRSDEILGESPAIRSLLEQIELVARTDANVLVLGESGTGKELVAREIHKRSPRSAGPLIKVNCASVPKELFESEFFGHVKGAFTGAIRNRTGRFELADGGTLFLDEVGEIPLELQGKLLRVLQEREFESVGEERTRTVDVRIVAATNRDLKQEVDEGRFREDLFYRLSVFPIEVAPLRDRREDIPILADRFLQMACKRMNRAPCRLSRENERRLQDYHWPGNVRELQNGIERSLILSRSGSPVVVIPVTRDAQLAETSPLPAADEVTTYADIKALERAVVTAALERASGRVNGAGGAAELLGIKPSTLFSRLKAMGIQRPR